MAKLWKIPQIQHLKDHHKKIGFEWNQASHGQAQLRRWIIHS